MPDMRDWTNDQVNEWMKGEVAKAKMSPRLPSVDRQSDDGKWDRIRALELSTYTHRLTPSGVLAFINGETTTTLLTPLTQLLQSCYNVFLAQDMTDHVAVFDRVTDMRDAYGGVLAAMDELGIPRPRVEGAVEIDLTRLKDMGNQDG